MVSEKSGAAHSSKHVWDSLSTRHKRFGASNLGFQVIIPTTKLEKLLIPNAEISQLRELSEILSQNQFAVVKNIFFDLDGTLHDFRASSRTAMNSVYEKIEQKYSLQRDGLARVYGEILGHAEKQAFREGKTSHEYRTERFTALLKHFSIENDEFVAELVETYGDTFEGNLSLDDSVLQTLQELSRGYELYLLTEGPLDAQIRTIEKLGIRNFFEKVYTSGEYREIKETGKLYSAAQNDLHLQADDIVVVGDTPSRDIRGANLAGIKSILAKIYS